MTIQVPTFALSWTFWFTVAGVVVVLAAALLVTILLVARSIHGHALRALEAVRRIDEHTAPIWRLAGVVDDLGRIRDAAVSVTERTEALAAAVHDGRGERARPGGAP